MSMQKLVALVLMVGGVLALAFGSFTYVKSTDTTKLGPIEFSIKDKETVNIPVWAGAGALVAGGALLAFSLKKK